MWREVLNFSLKNGSTLVATQANVWQGSLTVEQVVSTEDAFEIGSTHIGQMTVTLADIEASRITNAVFSINSEWHLILDGERVSYQTVYANTDFTDAVVVVYMAQNADDLQQMGVYNVVSAVRDEGTISITAYDNVTKLSVPYETSLSFPSTYGAMASEICGTVMTFDGSTTAVAAKPEGEDLTKREVLGYIAQACGYNVMCDNMGRFQFVRYNLSGFDTEGQYHAISSLYDFHHSQYPVVITGTKVIVVTTVDTTDPDTGEVTSEEVTNTYTSGTDDYQIVIEGNPLITTANGQAVADLIFATYGGVSFYTGTVSHISDLSIKVSDIMKVTDRLGNTYPMLVSSTRISTGAAQSTGSYAEEPASKLSVQPTELSRVQNSVRQALLDARNGKNKANYASRIASNTNQYFWHTETGADTGAHITEIPQEDFLADPTNGGGNLLARSNGIAIRNGLTELAQFTFDEAAFNDGNGNRTASFGAYGAHFGSSGNSRLDLNNIGLIGVNNTDDEVFRLQFASMAGTARIVEYGNIVTNTNPDPSVFPRLSVTPNADPADETQIAYRILVQVTYDGKTRVKDLDASRSYDSATSEIRGLNVSLTWSDDGATYGLTLAMSWNTSSKTTSFNNIRFSSGTGTIDKVLVHTTLDVDAPIAPSYTFGTRTENRLEYGAYSFASGETNSAKGASAHAHGLGLIASSDAQMVAGKYNVEDANDGYAFIIGNGADDSNRSNALTVDWDGVIDSHTRSYEPTWVSGQEPANYHCVVSAGLCSIFYQGPVATHTTNTLIGTLPVGARPMATVFCPFVKAGVAYGTIRIEATGEIYVGFISSTTASNRIYFNCSYPVA